MTATRWRQYNRITTGIKTHCPLTGLEIIHSHLTSTLNLQTQNGLGSYEPQQLNAKIIRHTKHTHTHHIHSRFQLRNTLPFRWAPCPLMLVPPFPGVLQNSFLPLGTFGWVTQMPYLFKKNAYISIIKITL